MAPTLRSTKAELFDALPGYPGGKRRLLPVIAAGLAKVVPPNRWSEMTFADPFLGGGAVSLWAKAQGFKHIYSNDVSERSATIGRALIANSSVRLQHSDLIELLSADPSVDTTGGLLDRVEAPVVREFLVRARARVFAMPAGACRDMLMLLVLRVAISYFPMGLPSASDAPHVATGDFDRVSAPRLQHYLGAGRRMVGLPALQRAAERVNAAIIPGSATISRKDAFSFLPAVEADVAYLDPPYAGTQSYEKVFELLDDFIGTPPLEVSPFSSRKAPLDDLLEACRHIPIVALSLNNSVLDQDELTALVGRHRHVALSLAIPYRHYASLATDAKNEANRELFVVARRSP